MDTSLRWLLFADSVHQNQVFGGSFKLASHVETLDDEVCAHFQKICFVHDIFSRNLCIIQRIWIHYDNPLDQLNKSKIKFAAKIIILSLEIRFQEYREVLRITFGRLLQWDLFGQEIAGIHAQIVVQDDERAGLL